MKILDSRSLYYDDVNLIAQPNGLIKSRKEIKTDPWRIFVSPMPAIVGEKFAVEAGKYGVSVCLHRFCEAEYQIWIYKKFLDGNERENSPWCSIGLNDDDRFKKLYLFGARKFIIDVANGYLGSVIEYAKTLKNLYPSISLMVGNVHDKTGFNLYKSVLTKYRFHNTQFGIRVGISSGSGCSTQRSTGINRGQITEISECASWRENPNHLIISDGGIKDSGCAVKAFAAGANCVMMGGFFSLAEEAQNVINKEYKFWGCASQYNQEKYGGVRNHSEGKVLELDKKNIRPLRYLIEDLFGGISSGCSYLGYNKWENMIGNGIFEIKK